MPEFFWVGDRTLIGLMRLITSDFTVNIAELTGRPATHWHDLCQTWKISENQSHQSNQCSILSEQEMVKIDGLSVQYGTRIGAYETVSPLSLETKQSRMLVEA